MVCFFLIGYAFYVVKEINTFKTGNKRQLRFIGKAHCIVSYLYDFSNIYLAYIGTQTQQIWDIIVEQTKVDRGIIEQIKEKNQIGWCFVCRIFMCGLEKKHEKISSIYTTTGTRASSLACCNMLVNICFLSLEVLVLHDS